MEETKKTDRKKISSKGWVLIWAGIYLLNYALLVAFLSLFVYTQPGPLTAARLAQLPYFEGCEILDVLNEVDTSDLFFGKADSDWALYQSASGEVHLVRIGWNLYTPRFRIFKSSDKILPAGEQSYSIAVRDGFGQYSVTIENQSKITKLEGRKWLGGSISRDVAPHLLAALAMLLAENAVQLLVERARKRRA